MKEKNCGRCSGQILVLAVLLVSLVLLSTQLYIYEVGKSLQRIDPVRANDFVFTVKLGSRHVVIGSLANISVGGDNSILFSNLERWVSFLGGLYQFGKPVLNFLLRNMSPYTNGTYLSWGINAFGVSSAYVDFNFSLLDRQVNVSQSYIVNVTTSLMVEGVYQTLQGSVRQINVTCNVLNERVPALAENVTVLYENSGSWLRADEQSSYSFTDYGNGTYLISFEADILGENVNVSAQVYDLRGIYVQANATCANVP
ncbi:MAG: hypothetical protein ACE5KD_03245 [Candidatus Bathyarchaeia archaeon]